jgi:phage terminase small subunit
MPKTRGITPKQKIFADEYIKTGNGQRSALKAYDTVKPKVATVIASENLIKPSVIEYMQSVAPTIANHIFKLATKAKSEQVQIVASKDILDRAGYKATDKLLISGNFTLQDIFDKAKEIEIKAIENTNNVTISNDNAVTKDS